MRKTESLIMCLLLLMMSVSMDAQTRKTTRKRTKAKTTQVQKTQEPVKVETVAAKKKEEPKHKSLSDPAVVRYLRSGFAKDGKLNLITNADYAKLSTEQKRDVLSKVAKEFAGYDMKVYPGDQQRELWISTPEGVTLLSQWNNDSLRIEDYLPLELQKSGETKVFYYVGGTFSGGDGYTNGSLNLRGGSYLYKNILDASVTLNLGYNHSGDEGEFAGDVGVDTRAYIPINLGKLNLAPYAGTGVSWAFAPTSYFEWRLLAGGCWFVGPGSLDIGLQYGTKSDFSLTLGYTFRIPVKKKQKK